MNLRMIEHIIRLSNCKFTIIQHTNLYDIRDKQTLTINGMSIDIVDWDYVNISLPSPPSDLFHMTFYSYQMIGDDPELCCQTRISTNLSNIDEFIIDSILNIMN